MSAAGLVVLEIHPSHVRRKTLPQEIDQHHHVGLLDDLGPLRALAPEQHIHWSGSRLESREVDLFQAKVATELLEQARALVKAGVEIPGDLQPARWLSVLKAEPARQRLPLRGPAPCQKLRDLLGGLQVPLRHDVGIGVVVDRLVILVRPNDAPDVVTAIVLAHHAARPEAGGLDQDLRSRLDEEALVTGRFPVAPYGEGDVCTDVQLLLAGQNSDHLAVGGKDEGWGGLVSAVGRLPGIESAAVAEPRSFGPRSRKRVIAVHDERPCRLGIGQHEERQHEDVGIPEDVPLVGGSSQAAGADRDPLVLRICRAHQMIDGKTERTLRIAIAFDAKV